jgi:catechol 2,3-dioxygenase-like lactoylglutathione lyase family enzyme
MSPEKITHAQAEESPTVLSPKKLAHVVVHTMNIRPMIQFYKNFLVARIEFESDRAAFLGYDEEHHRIGIIVFDNLALPAQPAPGLEHIAFTFDNLQDLVTAYEQRKAYGIRPTVCTNHGPTTSMYYMDPDGNRLESQVDNFDNAEEATAFVKSASFRENPVGVDFDPEELAHRVRSGEDEASIKKRADIGPREIPTMVPTIA